MHTPAGLLYDLTWQVANKVAMEGFLPAGLPSVAWQACCLGLEMCSPILPTKRKGPASYEFCLFRMTWI